jgi:hypothetical protein
VTVILTVWCPTCHLAKKLLVPLLILTQFFSSSSFEIVFDLVLHKKWAFLFCISDVKPLRNIDLWNRMEVLSLKSLLYFLFVFVLYNFWSIGHIFMMKISVNFSAAGDYPAVVVF